MHNQTPVDQCTVTRNIAPDTHLPDPPQAKPQPSFERALVDGAARSLAEWRLNADGQQHTSVALAAATETIQTTSPLKKTRPRLEQIETLRGLACLLLVFYHVVGADDGLGLRVSDDSWLRYLCDSLSYLRMPLFTFLSGYIYAMRPVSRQAWRGFIAGKARRLLLPMVVVGTLFMVLQIALAGGESATRWSALLTAHVVPVAHFWFIESLFWVFLLVAWLECRDRMNSPARFAWVLAVVALVWLGIPGQMPVYFGLAGALYLLPFFLGGLAVARFPELRTTEVRRWFAAAALLGVLAIQLGMLGWAPLNVERHGPWSLLIGLTATAWLATGRWNNGLLIRLGAYSFAIYLFHPVFSAAVRGMLNQLHVVGVAPHLVAGMLAGIAGPIAVELVVARWPRLGMVLLGQSPPKPPAAALQDDRRTDAAVTQPVAALT